MKYKMPLRLPTLNESRAREEYIEIMTHAHERYEEEFKDIEFYKKFTKTLRSIFHKKQTKTNTKRLRNCFNIIEEFGGCNNYSATKLIVKYGMANAPNSSAWITYIYPKFDLECFYEIMTEH
tara:strand:+ start:68 stop:433 length:366 start_codon:yes stop_codon:yes gene_type:complete